MSKIFDALRKAEPGSMDLLPPALETELRQAAAPPREQRHLEAEFGRLVSAVLGAFTKSKEGKVVLVVGAAAREGATYVTANLGRVLAAVAGGSILGLDANFHAPDLARHLGAKSGLGLSDVLENGHNRDLGDVVQRGDTPNLFVVTPGRKRTPLFDTPEFEALLASARRSFRFTLVDGPPLLAHPDSIHLAARADGVILVVRQGRLKREVLQKATEMIQSVQAPILGAVLNRRRFVIPNLVYKLIS